jgi:hypothetical protein
MILSNDGISYSRMIRHRSARISMIWGLMRAIRNGLD